MAEEALLRKSIYNAVDAARVYMFGTGLSLQYILTEKVVLAWHYSIVLNIEKLLGEMLAFAIRKQTEICDIKAETIEPFLRRKQLINGSECVNLLSIS